MARPHSSRLATQLIVPFVVLVIALAGTTVFLVSRGVFDSARDQHLSMLADATTRGQIVVDGSLEDAARLVAELESNETFQGAVRRVSDGDAADEFGPTIETASLATSDVDAIVVLSVPDAGGTRVSAAWDTAAGTLAPREEQDVALIEAVAADIGLADNSRTGVVEIVESVGWLSVPTPSIVLATPIESNGTVTGTVLAIIDANKLVDEIRRVTGFDAALVAPDHEFITTTFGANESGPFGDAEPAIEAMKSGERSSSDAAWRGGEYAVAFAPISFGSGTTGVVGIANVTDMIGDSVSSIQLALGAVLVVGLGAALVVGYLLSRRITNRLAELVEASDGVASGDFARRVDERGSDELSELAQHFNDMAEHLGRFRAEREGVISHLRAVELAKDELVANVSHELRTPLTPIKGFAAALGRDDLDAQTRREYAEVISKNSDRLLVQVNRLIAASSTTEGEMLGDETTDVASAIELVLSRLSGGQRDRVTQHVDDDLPGVDGAHEAICQVVFELVDNALKFTDGAVDVMARLESDERVEIVVSDCGPGIPESEREAVFDRFYQIDGSATRGFGGLGLGLAVSREIIEWTGGQIEIRPRSACNDDPLPGTSIRVIVPTADAGRGSGVQRVSR